MSINQILAVVWIVICCFWVVYIIRALPGVLDSFPATGSDRFFVRFVAMVIVVLALIGVVASMLLLFGVTWALWFNGLLAALITLAAGVGFVGRRPKSILGKILLAVLLITLVIVIGWAVNIFRF